MVSQKINDRSLHTGNLTIEREDIFEFAAQFDPQPYHLDSELADASIFGGLCASGWQVTALLMRLVSEAFRRENLLMTSVDRVSSMRWKYPVFAGDSIAAQISLGDAEADPERPECQRVQCEVLATNQHDKPVLAMSSSVTIQPITGSPADD